MAATGSKIVPLHVPRASEVPEDRSHISLITIERACEADIRAEKLVELIGREVRMLRQKLEDRFAVVGEAIRHRRIRGSSAIAFCSGKMPPDAM